MGDAMIYSGSIYFFGNYRPAHFQAASVKALRAAMLASIKQMNMDDWQYFAFRIDDLAKQLRKNYTSVSADYGARGVAMRKRPHDPFLDSVTRDLPEYPGLAYGAHYAINGAA